MIHRIGSFVADVPGYVSYSQSLKRYVCDC